MESRQTENKKFSTFQIKSRSTGRPLVSSTTELTGLVPGVGDLLLVCDVLRILNCLRLWRVYKYAIV